jgi:uncharacterized protein (TIGR03086 family)
VAIVLLAGGTTEEAQAARESTTLGPDPLADLRSSADALDSAFRAADLDHVIHHRVGDLSARQFLGIRFTDYAVHAWDLARAIGADEALDAELVATAYQAMVPMGPFIASSGQYGNGPSAAPLAGASLQDRLLDLSGRRP